MFIFLHTPQKKRVSKIFLKNGNVVYWCSTLEARADMIQVRSNSSPIQSFYWWGYIPGIFLTLQSGSVWDVSVFHDSVLTFQSEMFQSQTVSVLKFSVWKFSVWDVSVSDCFSLKIFSLRFFSLRHFSLGDLNFSSSY